MALDLWRTNDGSLTVEGSAGTAFEAPTRELSKEMRFKVTEGMLQEKRSALDAWYVGLTERPLLR